MKAGAHSVTDDVQLDIKFKLAQGFEEVLLCTFFLGSQGSEKLLLFFPLGTETAENFLDVSY